MVGPSPHKPRRKVKRPDNGSEISTVTSPSSGRSQASRPTYPLAAFFWPARSSLSQWEILPLILMAVGLFRWAAGLWGYSGMLSRYSEAVSTKFWQAFRTRQYTAITRLKDTGWRSRLNCRYLNGTFTISNTGEWIIRL